MERITLITKPSDAYSLLDAGAERKLEKFGDVTLVRPDPQALWPFSLPEEEWSKADAYYERKEREGEWHARGSLPKEWPIHIGDISMIIRPTSFKHTGIFPEQIPNWSWLSDLIAKRGREGKPVSVLNLFAYTGGATLSAAAAGAEVCHVDASKTAVAWARENAKASGLEDKPIRWIIEDVATFVDREIKRGKKYDVVIMDPPAFGHGPKDELWKIEEHLLPLLARVRELLSDKPLAVLLNGYAAGYSPLVFAYNLTDLEGKYGGSIEYGELTIEEKKSKRLLPCGICARWSANQ